MLKNKGFALTTLSLALASVQVIAQEEAGFFVEADSKLINDDNIYRVTDELAKSDTFITIAPRLALIGGFGKHSVKLEYIGDYAKYSEYDEANFTDHNLSAVLNLEHSLRFSSKFEAGFQREHEEPGSFNRIQLNLTEFNKYDQEFVHAALSYGQESAIGRVTVSYQKTNKDYKNNNLDYLDFTSDQFNAQFFYRVAPKTRVYIEATHSEYDYEPTTTFELDNTFKRYRAGLIWDFTNKLTGDLNVGYQDRDYTQPTLRDIDGLAYDGTITWNINTYTSIGASAKRESIDSTLENSGGFLQTSYGVELTHELTELLRITGAVGYATDELVFNTSREDERTLFEVGLDYDFLRYMTVGVSYRYENRESTDALAEYEANILSINLSIALDD